ncbi:polyubiquitin binding protein [Coccidioides immitis RS]|uniref:Polyubiquitin binding protein n=1 Tax=Coccidioides immitis (strain RS) TaxID=246410 RepID=J3K8Z5_COCIM|nr:polyubiquitin binding protein [Coccidioides immitis RS]EAS31334.3 polyubiquitin binding protein [Coccidioides immitis RS]
MPDFKISAALEGHSDDVRAVAFPDAKKAITASRDATVRLWNLVSSPPPAFDYTISAHGSAFVNALAFYPPTQGYPEGLIFSGGQDTIIEARQPGRPAEADAEALLLGHAHNICSIDVCPEGGWVVSGSWDSSARLWTIGKWECDTVLDGHSGSVWAVLAYDKNTIVTGCADKSIRVFDRAGRLRESIQGSGDVIRALCKLPNGHASGAQIASAGNDGIIRLWTLHGQQIDQLYGHESFIYSLAVLPSGELVSSGEDRTVRIWQGSKCVQTITHPAISVWSVAVCRETGDIITGASDRIARVFSRVLERQGDDALIQQFESAVKESSIPQEQVGKINKEKLPGPEFLKQKMGTKEGQVQMIKEDDGSVTAHTWSSATREWVAVGTVVDSVGSSGKKVEYQGQDYDYVFDVDIEDGKPPLKLPYNLSQNPYDVATKFIQSHQLPVSYLDQVANFIMSNTQGATIGGPSQPATHAGYDSQHAPSLPTSRPKVLPQASYLSIRTANMKAIQKKIGELNAQLVSAGSKDISLSPSDLETVSALCNQLEQTTTLKDSPLLEAALPSVVRAATLWPAANRLPGLDLLRLLAAASPMTATEAYSGGNLVQTIISSGIFDSPLNSNNVMLAVRMLANLFETEAGQQLVTDNFEEITSRLKSVLSDSAATANRNLTIAVTTLYINLAVFLTSNGRSTTADSAERSLVLLDQLTKIISKEKDSEAVYRGLVALGTLVIALGEEVKAAAKEVYDLNKTLAAVMNTAAGREPRVKGVISEIKDAI